jgi:hypothetical protein
MNNFECPICMESIDSQNNIIITECGHKFHCKCLMMNIEHNGFGCPYCRQKMITNKTHEQEDEEDDYSEYNDDDVYHYQQQDNSRALRGMRWLFATIYLIIVFLLFLLITIFW